MKIKKWHWYLFLLVALLILPAAECGGGDPTPVPTLSTEAINENMIPDDLPEYKQWHGICTYVKDGQSTTITYENEEAYSKPTCPSQGEGWELLVDDWIEAK